MQKLGLEGRVVALHTQSMQLALVAQQCLTGRSSEFGVKQCQRLPWIIAATHQLQLDRLMNGGDDDKPRSGIHLLCTFLLLLRIEVNRKQSSKQPHTP